jgi:phosphoketolase
MQRLFTAAKPVVFAFHGYQPAVLPIIHGRTNTDDMPEVRDWVWTN